MAHLLGMEAMSGSLERRDVTPIPKPEPRKPKGARALAVKSHKRWLENDRRDAVRVRVFNRDGGCVLHGEKWAPNGDVAECAGQLTVHHRLKSSAGGRYIDENLVALCRFHNCSIEDHPAWVRANYPWLVVRRGDEEFNRLAGIR